LNHELRSAKKVTSATAARGVCGQRAIARIAARIGPDVASTYPVMMMSDICSVNGMRSQKPLPQASMTCVTDAGVQTSAATTTTTVAISAKMNASGTHFSVHAVSARAARATKPGCSSTRASSDMDYGRVKATSSGNASRPAP
jgi:hypothetical protein